MRIKKGDKVVVISGSDKGKEGQVLQCLVKEDRVVVDGVNVRKKHVKPSQSHPEGALVEKSLSIHVSNVALIDPKTKQKTKVKYAIENGKKVRIAKKSGTKI